MTDAVSYVYNICTLYIVNVYTCTVSKNAHLRDSESVMCELQLMRVHHTAPGFLARYYDNIIDNVHIIIYLSICFRYSRIFHNRSSPS